MGLVQYLLCALLSIWHVDALATPKAPRASCGDTPNGPNSRQCWTPGYDIDTNYYESWPNTGVVREYWLDLVNTTIAPDGVEVQAILFNGTLPGPLIWANWGDMLKVHITNRLETNGTNTHWHGIRQLNSNQYDGTAGMTECPIAPGSTKVHMFNTTQYGHSWYHSHFSVQYGAGAWGPLVIYGPSTANWDEDLGPLFIGDWSHIGPFAVLEGQVDANIPSNLNGALLNGMNQYPPCSGAQPVKRDAQRGPQSGAPNQQQHQDGSPGQQSSAQSHGQPQHSSAAVTAGHESPNQQSTNNNYQQAHPTASPAQNAGAAYGQGSNQASPTDNSAVCVNQGQRYTANVTSGQRYLLRLINNSVQSYFRVTIDDHNFTVVANDYVAVQPYDTASLAMGPGQRYDIIVEANQPVDNYWIRGVYLQCYFAELEYANNTLGILHYSGAANADPTTSNDLTDDAQCSDVSDSLVPYLAINPGPADTTEGVVISNRDGLWEMNGSSFMIDWRYPTITQIYANETLEYLENGTYADWQTEPARFDLDHIYKGLVENAENVYEMPVANQWLYFTINSQAGLFHPMHLHGHDFYILSQGFGNYNGGALNTNNPPRRDVATLMPGGHLVLAWRTDNPGVWNLHCHIVWHISQGLGVQFVEQRSNILQYYNSTLHFDQCDAWGTFLDTAGFGQDDSGF